MQAPFITYKKKKKKKFCSPVHTIPSWDEYVDCAFDSIRLSDIFLLLQPHAFILSVSEFPLISRSCGSINVYVGDLGAI